MKQWTVEHRAVNRPQLFGSGWYDDENIFGVLRIISGSVGFKWI